MMDFLATNFNLPTIIVGAIVFGGVGWATWHSHKHGGCGGCGEGGCNGSCKENAEELAKFKRIAEEKAKANASQVH